MATERVYRYRVSLQQAPGVGVTVVAPADPQRLYIGFCGPSANSYRVTPDVSQGAGNGIFVGSNALVEFYWSRHGPLVQAAWGASNGVPTSFTMLEVFLVPSGEGS